MAMTRPVRTPDIAELRAFCAAVDLGSLGRAARLLRLSQPALSKRLRTLEALAGAKLLDRSPRGVTPTPAGTRLYMEARKLLAQAEAIEELMAGLSDEDAPIRLAASHTIAEFVLPEPLVAFERRGDRHLSVELVVGNSILVRELVLEGRAEFGIAAVDGDGSSAAPLQALPFLDDEVVVAVPREHPWAALDAIPLDELIATPMVMRDPSAHTRRTVEAVLGARDLALAPPVAEVGSTSAAREAALSEGVPVLLSRLAVGRARDPLVPVPVEGLSFARRFAFLLGDEGNLSRAARALLRHLQGNTPES
jgi:DNA-binding transcriptional LysR family regulator